MTLSSRRTRPALVGVFLWGLLGCLPASAAPPPLPRCPDAGDLTIAYRDPYMDEGTTLRPESLLIGVTAFWATAGRDTACRETASLVELFVDEAPVPLDTASQRFVIDLGGRLLSHLVRLQVTLTQEASGEVRTVTRSVRTMDASGGARRTWVGSRLQEAAVVAAPPVDTLVLTMSAEGPDGPVLDLTKEEVKVVVDGKTSLRGDDITGFEPPSGNLPVRLLLAFDVSAHLEKGKEGLGFNREHRTYVREVVLPALRMLKPRPLEGRPLPPIELGFARYGRTVEWHARPFWRLDEGIREEQIEALATFLLSSPPAAWVPDQADGITALESLKGLWHFFRGRRGVFLAVRSPDVFSGMQEQVFSPSVLDPDWRTISRLNDAADRLDRGDGEVARAVLQHTERRSPKIYVWLPAAGFPGKASSDLPDLAVQSGGEVRRYGEADRAEVLAQGIDRSLEDLIRSYRLSVEIPNDRQKGRTREVWVNALRRGVDVRAQRAYRTSRGLCEYLPSYLIDPDPVLRLVAAGQVGSCGESAEVATMVRARLFGGGEANSLVLARLLRGYVQLLLRELQGEPGRGRRREILDELDALDPPATLLEPVLLGSYRSIARELAGD